MRPEPNRGSQVVRASVGLVLSGTAWVFPAAVSAADSGAWELVDPWLQPRGEHAMAYDSQRGAIVRTSLPEGSTVPVDNTDLENNTTDRRRVAVNDRGKAKATWRCQRGQHTITAADCPRLRQTAACDP